MIHGVDHESTQALGLVPDTLAGLWDGNFPSAELVRAAAGLFPGVGLAARELGTTLDGRARTGNVAQLQQRLFPDQWRGVRALPELETIEGPQWRVLVSPGSVSVRYTDPARAERSAARQLRSEQAHQDQLARRLMAGEAIEQGTRTRTITSWSRKSRARMVQVIQSLDWSELIECGRPAAMITLTYPGQWEELAPCAAAANRHLRLFRQRYERAWGHRLRAVWKREFQRRGAPHFHLLMVPPVGQVNGQNFRAWLSATWTDILAPSSCSVHELNAPGGCCERVRSLRAGTGLDHAAGAACTDPRRIGVYFSKHGSYSAKDYQNDAPQLWLDAGGSVGRFWGVWGLDKAIAGTLLHPADAIAAARTLRRLSRANAPIVPVDAWRYRTVVDPETGELRAKWRKVKKRRRIYHVRDGRSGFLAVADGPAVASQLARYLDQRQESSAPASSRARGRFLP